MKIQTIWAAAAALFLTAAAYAQPATPAPQLFDTMAEMNANTLETPIYWEAVEPVEGQFDFSSVKAIIDEARAHDIRLVLLWFATWKNGSPHYVPEWVKLDSGKYYNVVGKDGSPVDSPSPHCTALKLGPVGPIDGKRQIDTGRDCHLFCIFDLSVQKTSTYGKPIDQRRKNVPADPESVRAPGYHSPLAGLVFRRNRRAPQQRVVVEYLRHLLCEPGLGGRPGPCLHRPDLLHRL